MTDINIPFSEEEISYAPEALKLMAGGAIIQGTIEINEMTKDPSMQ